VISDLLDLVLPRRCLGCGAAARGLCVACVGADEPLLAAAAPVPVFAATAYQGAVRSALLRYKERGRRDLARPLGELLSRAVAAVLQQHAGLSSARPVLVGIPSSRVDAAVRGGDHVARLARRAAIRCGTPYASGVLALARAKRDSTGLDVRARAENLAGAFLARPAAPHAAAVIVDDIVTTGATVREVARVLAAAGWPVLGAAAVAATPRYDRRADTAVPLATRPPSG
jgi:predicted amidophosphoribosyltransferase